MIFSFTNSRLTHVRIMFQLFSERRTTDHLKFYVLIYTAAAGYQNHKKTTTAKDYMILEYVQQYFVPKILTLTPP